jgi:stress response protein YsnF
VRIHTSVEERPVEETVRLRDEEVNVERRTVDRPVSGAEAEAAFREGDIELEETHEEAVVSKEARVVEEVVVDKDVREREEVVRDTVRRTEVDVEETTTPRAERR